MSSTPTRWSARGFDLRMILAQVWASYEDEPIFLAQPLEDKKLYDFVVTTPAQVSDGDLKSILQPETARYFHICVRREQRLLPVLVLAAPHGASAALHREPDWGNIFMGGAGGSDRDLSVRGESMDGLCHFLGMGLHKIVVNETGLQGRYSFRAKSNGNTGTPGLLQKVGLQLTPGERQLEVLTVESDSSPGTAR